jgi:FtsP/CotA-like multicopper oxidase with cupredoxin domain
MAYGPKLPNPTQADGKGTFYYPNQQSSRMMFYHDHSYGLTRLNVYAGEVAGYLVTDAVEQGLISSGILPGLGTPLIIQDKTFVSSTTATTDPLWPIVMPDAQLGDLWFPHVYQPNQMPADGTMNPKGRWDYGAWFWPPIPITEPTLPTTSIVPEAFMDTPVINGTAYPFLQVERKAYRFRILNGCNDRMLNLQLYFSDPQNPKEVKMVPAHGQTVPGPYGNVTVPADGRPGGVPDPATAGPPLIQIGTEGGFLPGVVLLNNPPQPVDYDYDRRSATLGNVTDKTLFLGPAERADIIIDFSTAAPGSNLILYNDAPAPTPLFDPRYDFYTGNPDYSATGLDMGGAPSTQAGFGPNTRTLMQFRVKGTPEGITPPPFIPPALQAALQAALPTAYASSHNTADDPPYLVPPGVFADNRFASLRGTPPNFQNFPVMLKTLVEDFDGKYGRMNTQLGTERTSLDPAGQNAFGYFYIDPATETIPEGTTQIWSVIHNGIDTHAIHFHLVNVQVINRVDWAGVIKPPDPNELGWKETVRMNPFENVVLAVRPTKPALNFGLPKSRRPLDVTMPLGSTTGFTNPGPNGLPTVNVMTDFDWEYVWHCHLLGHEENDMMRPLVMQVATVKPSAPTGLGAAAAAGTVNLSWTDPTPADAPATLNNPANETSFKIQRATDNAFTTGLKNLTAPANATTFTDSSVVAGTNYFYRVRALNASGVSGWSNIANVLP